MEWIELDNGFNIPQLGYGTFQLKAGEVYDNVRCALENGYRMIDTAASYFNEQEIGRAIRDSGIPREEIVISTKVWVQDTGYEQTKKAFERSLENLQTGYIDIYLIHQPYGDYYGSWKAMEELYRASRIKAIGVCNFCAERLIDLTLNAEIPPMIDQVELHPFFQQKRLYAALPKTCRIEAWGPLNEGQRNIFANPVLKYIADRHHKTVAQVVLRWLLEQGIIAIPRSGKSDHQKENIDHSDPLTVRILNTDHIHE